MKRLYLYPGGCLATPGPAEITTVLGSCIAVALTDPRLKVSGMCHYLLPHLIDPPGPLTRYGEHAIPMLIDALSALGANPARLVARVYGGARVMGNISLGAHIGDKNTAIARSLLESLKIPILHEDTGGQSALKLTLDVESFEVKLTRMLERDNLSEPVPEERGVRALLLDALSLCPPVLDEHLRKAGVLILARARDSFDGRMLIQSKSPDCLLFGAHDQPGSGTRLIRDLQKMMKLPPFLAFSLGGSGLNVSEALDLGAFDFLHAENLNSEKIQKMFANMLAEKMKSAIKCSA